MTALYDATGCFWSACSRIFQALVWRASLDSLSRNKPLSNHHSWFHPLFSPPQLHASAKLLPSFTVPMTSSHHASCSSKESSARWLCSSTSSSCVKRVLWCFSSFSPRSQSLWSYMSCPLPSMETTQSDAALNDRRHFLESALDARSRNRLVLVAVLHRVANATISVCSFPGV